MSKKMMEGQKLFIGLDIGTESVGFAATDENYNVICRHGKPCMGVNLFEEAQTAKERRVARATKVRQERAIFRITLLQELLNGAIGKVDPLFFIRLKASAFWEDDKKAENAGLVSLDSLFADLDFNDRTYYKNFKTIYHLREFLMNEQNWLDKKVDIRFVYLACHHILKNRGHFLYDSLESKTDTNEDFSVEKQGAELFERLNDYLQTENDREENPSAAHFDLAGFDSVVAVSKDEKLKKTKKAETLLAAFGFAQKDKDAVNILKLITGQKVKIRDLLPDFPEDSIDDDFKSKGFSFAEKWETNEPLLQTMLDDDYELVALLKEIYDWFTLMLLLKGEKSVSIAKIKVFDTHKRQLDDLKKLVKEYDTRQGTKLYFKLFRANDEPNNYAAYIGSNFCNGKSIIKKCTLDDLYAFLKKEYKEVLTQNILEEIENHVYLQKLRTKDNSTIPYQLHMAELKKILLLAEKYKFIDCDICDKICSVMSFRVPYYVGRLSTNYNKIHKEDTARHAWIVRHSNQPIRPWNYQEVIDLPASGEQFITRMLSKCSYLRRETVLPKNSLLYCEFTVLNEINKLKINGEAISPEVKQQIFEKLFKTVKKVSLHALVDFLNKTYGCELGESMISGVDVEKSQFASLASYLEAKKIFGDSIDKKETQDIVEDVLLWQALFGDKKQVVDKIKSKYPQLDEQTVKKLKGLNFSGFGNLSRTFLTSTFDFRDGGKGSIIELLHSTNNNLMEIINDDNYGVKSWLNKQNYQEGESVDYDDLIDQSYAAPSVKRSVRQAMKVVDELVELIGKSPDKIFIEVTRSGAQKKERTKSRRQLLKDKFSQLDKSLRQEMESELERADVTDDKLRSQKLYLYFLQCGKCAYSGKTIPISDIIAGSTKYDIDHIIPQALKKDDGLSNLVLAKRELNGAKDKTYPISHVGAIMKYKDDIYKMWQDWHKCGLISAEKLRRLMCTTAISDRELEGFISRQLTFTGQSTIAVARILEKKYENQATICYCKAELTSEYRKKFGLLKCRDVNDLHHAHDAYLNIVVGNAYHTRFNNSKEIYRNKYDKQGEGWRTYSQNHIFEYNIDGAYKAGKWGKEWLDEMGANGRLYEMRQIQKGETDLIVEQALRLSYLPISKKTQENRGQLFNQTVYSVSAHQKEIQSGRKKLKTNDLIPRKGGNNPLRDSSKYGGYKSIRPAYFMIVEYVDKKDGLLRVFDSVSLMDKKRWEALTEEEQNAELSKKYKLPVRIVLSKTYIYSLFEIGGMECRLSGRNEKQIFFHNAKQLFVDKESSDYIRIIAKYEKLLKDKKINADDFKSQDEIKISGEAGFHGEIQRLTKDDNKRLWDVFLKKIEMLYGQKMKHLDGCGLGFPKLPVQIKEQENKFVMLPITEQIEVLLSLIAGCGCNARAFDLKALGIGSVGKIQPGYKIKYPLTLVHQSVTGIKENKIHICKVDKDGKVTYPPIESNK